MPPADGLAVQDLTNLDVSKLTPLSPEVISRQATINVGTIGHVAHGKSTVVRGLSGVMTIRFKQEKERNITIKLGYANAKIYKCQNPDCPNPGCYTSHGSAYPDRYTDEHGEWVVVRHVSFVDCPGHDILMATMLNGAAVMDAALLLIAANEKCPQPQTSEHLAAVEIMRLRHLIILQNKVELVTEAEAQQQYADIRNFVKGTVADSAPVVPISAVLRYNLDVVAEYLCTQIPVPVRDFTSSPQMIIIRSFDVNKPGQDAEELMGGVAGGSILKGVLKVGDEIEIRPGVISKDDQGHVTCRAINTKIKSLHAENNELQYAVPGGLIGVGTQMDPTLTRADRLVGHVLGYPGHLPDVYDQIEVLGSLARLALGQSLGQLQIKYHLLRRLLGVKQDADASKHGEGYKGPSITKLKNKEILMVNIGSTAAGGQIVGTKTEGSVAKVQLAVPVCANVGDKLALSRRIDKHWRLIGYGEIVKGKMVSGKTA